MMAPVKGHKTRQRGDGDASNDRASKRAQIEKAVRIANKKNSEMCDEHQGQMRTQANKEKVGNGGRVEVAPRRVDDG
ncbi:hypothetical protein VTJ04DRAFT_1687 [Mycothermus thermophilus]|uniref:uncharacterized protein n=1 Tax=Humicola insolens TaxID=85995 RepID=UPI0037441672